MRRVIDYAGTLQIWLDRLAPDLPQPVCEHQFDTTRRWRFDFAFIDERLAMLRADASAERALGLLYLVRLPKI